MQLLSIGINHHTAPLALRERVAFPLEQIKPALQTLKQAWLGRNRKNSQGGASRSGLIVPAIELSEAAILLSEAAILSTCNRTELYCASDEHSVREQAIAWLSQYHNVPAAELAPHVYALPQSDAVRHAFRVASGLDSMVLGETQILGQIKDAVRTASEAGAMGTYLHQLFQRSFAVAKEVRRQTEIGMHSVSMAAAAVRLAQRIFESIADQRILFIGAGEMIELCATHFAAHQPRALVIANRTAERSSALAQRCNGSTLPLASLPAQLHQFDIVISCTASTLPIIGLGAVESALRARRRRPIFMVDLAVPRDIEPEIGQIEDVFLYTIDDLGSIVREGHAQRQAAVAQAEAIIEKQVRHFMQWLETRSVVPVIHGLHHQADQMRTRELERARKMLARGDDPDIVLEALSRSLTNKFLHGPTRALKSVNTRERETLITLLPGLFQE